MLPVRQDIHGAKKNGIMIQLQDLTTKLCEYFSANVAKIFLISALAPTIFNAKMPSSQMRTASKR
jgi:hypothetical protein